MAAPPVFKPGHIGHITTALYQDKNIGIDGKIYQIIDARVDRIKQDNPQLGDEVEYKISASKELLEKGKISFFAIKQRAVTSSIPPNVQPSAPPKVPADVQIVQAEYVSKDQVRVTLKDCMGQEQTFRADITIIKVLSKPDSPVQIGNKYKVQLSKQGEEWVVANMGKYEEEFGERPFQTGKEILQQNLDSKRAETEKAQAALAQIKKENEEGDKRIQENVESLKESVQFKMDPNAPKDEKGQSGFSKTFTDTAKQETTKKALSTLPVSNTPIESVKVPQNTNVAVPDAVAECPVELKVHLDCGSYSNFDLTVPAMPIDQAIARVEADAKKAIAVMHRLMAEAKKGY